VQRQESRLRGHKGIRGLASKNSVRDGPGDVNCGPLWVKRRFVECGAAYKTIIGVARKTSKRASERSMRWNSCLDAATQGVPWHS
jgi:hypothetical protein